MDLAFGAGLSGLLGGLVLLVVVLVTQGADKANPWASVLGAGLALTGALVTLVTWWARQRAAARKPATSEQVTRAAQELHAVVREQWRKEAVTRSLEDPNPMAVRWRLSDPGVMDHDELIGPIPLLFSGCSDQIPALAEEFRKLHRRRLVIIGGPGSGKTTLAVQLLLQLLEDWQQGEPVPVLLSLASWDPQAQPQVQNWLAAQLNQTYPNLGAFGTDIAQRLADQGRLLPVLDGLDEIPADRRGDVIERLNASLHSDNGVIVTSRTTEYTETVHIYDVLTAAAVVQPEPLTAQEAARYLRVRLPRQPDESWQAVLTALWDGTAGALAEVVASPLGLWLLRVVYIEDRRDPQPLVDPGLYPDAAAIQHHLLDELIPAAVRSRPPLSGGKDPLRPKRHHDPDKVRKWLSTLAFELRDANTLDWRWWQLARHTFTAPRLLGGLVGMIGGLVLGLAGGLVLGLGGLVFGLVGLTFGLAGLTFGLMVGLFGLALRLGASVIYLRGGAIYSDVPAHANFRIRGRTKELGLKLARSLMLGFVVGSWGGLLLGVVLGFMLLRAGPIMIGTGLGLDYLVRLGNRLGVPVGLLIGVLAGQAVGLAVGLMGGLISFGASPTLAQRANSPVASQRGDRKLTLLVTITFALLLPVLVDNFRSGGLFLYGLVGRGDALLGGLGRLGGFLNMLLVVLVGLLGGFLLGPVVTNTCWPAFGLASFWLGVRRRLPFRLMGFLDDAYRLGLLRIVGPVYQFRHVALQDHLAPPNEVTLPAVAPRTVQRSRR